jgi:predicted CXXCH cytochrome family protein
MSTRNKTSPPAHRSSLLTLTLLFSVILALPAAGAADKDKSCVDCHKKLITKRVVHPAIAQYARMEQGCPSCHTAPHGKQKAEKSLKEKVPGLCFQCHDKQNFSRAHVHPPVAAGDCTACHNPHASDNGALLAQPLPYLCQTCHDDKKDGRHILQSYGLGDDHPIQGRKDPSRIRRELSCTSCHNPHSSTFPRLFTAEATTTGALCMQCHRRVTVGS